MAATVKERKASMTLDYGKTHGRYTVMGLNPDANANSVYTLHQVVRSLQGDKPAEIYMQTEYELVNE